MAISTFSELKTAITDYLARSSTDIQSREADFIALIEGRFNHVLRTKDMQTSTSLSPSASVSLAAGSAALPSDYLEWISAIWTDGTNTNDLRYVEPDSEDWQRKFRPFGRPQLFTILTSTLFYARPFTTGTVSFFYYAAVPPLATNTTNWILQRYPDAYLHGSLMEAFMYIEEYEQAATHRQLLAEALPEVVQSSDTNKLIRRPQRQMEVQNIAEARSPLTGA